MTDVTVTKAAIKRIEQKRIEQKNDSLMLRIIVQAGGCSGFEYQFKLDDQSHNDDHVFSKAVIIDETSLMFLKNSQIDYVEELIGSDFKINNPNASSGCGCGASFAVTDF